MARSCRSWESWACWWGSAGSQKDPWQSGWVEMGAFLDEMWVSWEARRSCDLKSLCRKKKHKTGNYYFSIFYLFLAFLGQLSANFSFLGGLGPDFTAICYFSSFLQSSWFILSYLTLLQYMSDYLTVILSQLFCLIFCPHFLAIIFISLYYSANF